MALVLCNPFDVTILLVIGLFNYLTKHKRGAYLKITDSTMQVPTCLLQRPSLHASQSQGDTDSERFYATSGLNPIQIRVIRSRSVIKPFVWYCMH